MLCDGLVKDYAEVNVLCDGPIKDYAVACTVIRGKRTVNLVCMGFHHCIYLIALVKSRGLLSH